MSAFADFSGPYSVNPPANLNYLQAATNGAFGNWTGAWNSVGGMTLNTVSAPSALNILMFNAAQSGSTETYSFLVTAAATGLVSFNFSGNTGNGSVIFTDMTTAFSSSLLGSGLFSTNVNAGDIFGFKLTATYIGNSGLTVSNFSGPIPTTGVPEQGSTLALFALGFVGLMAYRTAAQRRAVARASD
ncbi:MAG: VPDSG-CTERM sorting domain-containing protein [Chthoniobacterales bacterium]